MQRILLIASNGKLRERTSTVLQLANYKVDTANNEKTGLELALKLIPNLIICDTMMPVFGEYASLNLALQNDIFKNIPFIFLIGKSAQSDFKKEIEMGKDDYIIKPFSDIELLTAIKNKLKNSTQKDLALATVQIPEDSNNYKALQDLVETSAVKFYKKKQLIYAEGNHPVRLFYIQKGKVKAYKSNDDGKELTICLYGEGDFVGYTAILEGTIYKETTEAFEDATLSIIAKDDFEELVRTNKEVAHQFMQLLAKNVTEREKQLVGIAYNSLRKRVAEALVQLQQKYTNNEEGKFSIHISREDLAHIAGTATESVIRTLSDFKNEKLIDIKDGSIIILQEKKLAALLN